MSLHGEPRSFNIAGRDIGPGHPPYVVAEMSANHMGRLERALEIIDAAAAAGADAVKLQTYRGDTITLDCDAEDFVIASGPRKGRTLFDVYSEGTTPWEWHPALFTRARERGLAVFSAPFDHSAVDFLETLDPPAYKVASCELVDLPLIGRIAATGRPMILSTGMATEEEIGEALAAARGAGCEQLLLLHCISGYPTPVEEANLRSIPALADRFEVPIGLSDHSMGTTVAVAAVALGACLVEKHFTLARADGGLDAEFSLEPHELETLCDGVNQSWRALGEVRYGVQPSEQRAFRNRRSLYVVEPLQTGEKFTNENVRSIRPGFGLLPRHLPDVIGRPATRSIARGTALGWEMVEK